MLASDGDLASPQFLVHGRRTFDKIQIGAGWGVNSLGLHQKADSILGVIHTQPAQFRCILNLGELFKITIAGSLSYLHHCELLLLCRANPNFRRR